LNNPYKFFTGVVEVEFDLVGRRTNGFITSELKLFDEVLVRVLGHSAALIGIKEDIVDVERGGNKGLLVSLGHRLSGRGGGKVLYGPQALTNRTEVNVDLDLVVLKGNEGKGKSGVAAKPEKKGNVEGGLRKGLARGTHLGRSTGGGTRTRDVGERRISHICKLSGVTNHLVVTFLLLGRHSKLVPDVHPVTVLTVDALTTNFNFNLRNKLMAGEI